MKPKYLFFVLTIVFSIIALKFALNGEKVFSIFMVACSIAGAANGMRPDANRRITRADLQKFL